MDCQLRLGSEDPVSVVPTQRRVQHRAWEMASVESLRAQIKAKRAELAALEKLKVQSAALVSHLEGMGGKFAELKDGTAGTCCCALGSSLATVGAQLLRTFWGGGASCSRWWPPATPTG